MSSESEKDKERLIQAANIFFFHIQDLVSFINTFIELFNLTMETQIPPMDMKEDNCIKDFFEQMIRNFKEMQLMINAKQNKMPKESSCSKAATAVSSTAEKCTNPGLHRSAKEMFRNIQTPITGSVLGSLEASLSLLMQLPIMDLPLSNFYRKDKEEQSEATTSEKIMSLELPKATTTDTLKKLQGALRTENANQPTEAAADQMEQFIKTMEPTFQALQKAIKTMETAITMLKKVTDK